MMNLPGSMEPSPRKKPRNNTLKATDRSATTGTQRPKEQDASEGAPSSYAQQQQQQEEGKPVGNNNNNNEEDSNNKKNWEKDQDRIGGNESKSSKNTKLEKDTKGTATRTTEKTVEMVDRKRRASELGGDYCRRGGGGEEEGSTSGDFNYNYYEQQQQRKQQQHRRADDFAPSPPPPHQQHYNNKQQHYPQHHLQQQQQQQQQQGGGAASDQRQAQQHDEENDVWGESLHRSLVEAIYEVGMKHASPSVIMEKMVLIGDKNNGDASATNGADASAGDASGSAKSSAGTALTSERVKSHLQKYRKNKVKSKTEFLDEYDNWIKKAISLGSSMGSSRPQLAVLSLMVGCSLGGTGNGNQCNFLGGDLAAYLSYCVMRDEGALDLGSGSYTSSASAMRRNDGAVEAISSGSPLSLNAARGQSAEYTKQYSGAKVPFPILTQEERSSPIGEAIGQVIGLFYPMTQYLMQERMKREKKKQQQQHQQSASADDGDALTGCCPGQQQQVVGTSVSSSGGHHDHTTVASSHQIQQQQQQYLGGRYAQLFHPSVGGGGSGGTGHHPQRLSMDESHCSLMGSEQQQDRVSEVATSAGGAPPHNPPRPPAEDVHHRYSGISPFHTDSIIQDQQQRQQ